MSSTAILSLDDGDIHVCQDGPRDAPALLLIHGSASLPGLGHSPLLEDPPRTAAPLPVFTTTHAVRVD